MDAPLSAAHLARWRTAMFTIFLVSGFGFASWASRIPGVKSALGITDAQVGSLLLVMGAAPLIGIPLANLVVARWGTRRGMHATLAAQAAGMIAVGVGVQVVESYPVIAVSLGLMGLGMGMTDVMMNVEAAAAEQAIGRTLMPLFHAFFSFGTVAGAGLGVVMAAAGVGIGWHVGGAGLLVLAAGLGALRWVPARDALHDDDPSARTRRERLRELLAVWRTPRTYAIGLIMLGVSFAEGAASDWLPIAVVDGHGQSEATGAIALTVFSVAMTTVRVLGGPLVDRFGRVWMLRVLSVTAAGGLALFILAPTTPLALIGVALWGAGASMGFPLGMSAAADDPARATASVSAAASIGYLAFLCGPPALGWVSDQIGILPTLWIIAVLIALSGAAAGAARPLTPAAAGSAHH
ncbi:MFS transporter [Microbacterium sp.]|uniref:MFS transporter n=1 Tax=Microbacterium sp. TaxID=51671 RepID=UPI003A83A408